MILCIKSRLFNQLLGATKWKEIGEIWQIHKHRLHLTCKMSYLKTTSSRPTPLQVRNLSSVLGKELVQVTQMTSGVENSLQTTRVLG